MASRDELKLFIDQMPEEKLDLVRVKLESMLDPPVLPAFPNPRVEMMMRRVDELENELPERLKELRAGKSPESIRGLGRGLSKGNVEYSMSWQEGRARVKHTLLLHEDHELDFVERLQLTEDEKTLVYEQEIYTEGRSVKRKEIFQWLAGSGTSSPMAAPNAQS